MICANFKKKFALLDIQRGGRRSCKSGAKLEKRSRKGPKGQNEHDSHRTHSSILFFRISRIVNSDHTYIHTHDFVRPIRSQFHFVSLRFCFWGIRILRSVFVCAYVRTRFAKLKSVNDRFIFRIGVVEFLRKMRASTSANKTGGKIYI